MHKKFISISSSRWVEISNNSRVREGISRDSYAVIYKLLRDHFQCAQIVSWRVAVVNLHVVYGWMQTIPKLSGISVWSQSDRDGLCEVLNRAIRGEDLEIEELEQVKKFSNNSIIGASKLLHLFNPEQFPIWDTRVAEVFFEIPSISYSAVNDLKKYIVYKRILEEWKRIQDVRDKCEEIRRLANHLHQMSDLRALEIVLFHGKTLNASSW